MSNPVHMIPQNTLLRFLEHGIYNVFKTHLRLILTSQLMMRQIRKYVIITFCPFAETGPRDITMPLRTTMNPIEIPDRTTLRIRDLSELPDLPNVKFHAASGICRMLYNSAEVCVFCMHTKDVSSAFDGLTKLFKQRIANECDFFRDCVPVAKKRA